MNKNKYKNFTVIDCERTEETTPVLETKKEYHSNPLKTDLYSRLSAFRNSQRKFSIKDAINDSLK